jgi:glycosyltransferase involved in cell wall biosynthesis
MPKTSRNKVALIITSPMVAKFFLLDQINALSKHYEVTLISNFLDDKASDLSAISKDVKFKQIPIRRKINLFLDIKTLFLLFKIFKDEQFSLVHSVSPKAGLLTAIAGYFASVPITIHTFTGQVWGTKSGLPRAVLKALDKLIVSLNTDIITDSRSQVAFLQDEGVLCSGGAVTFLSGSISGVDLDRFKPNPVKRAQTREVLAIPDDEFVLLYVGRFKQEKGLLELARAFKIFLESGNRGLLLLVGPDEECLEGAIREILKEHLKQVRVVGYVNNPEDFMVSADILTLPSHREGFGSVIIEGAACGLPSIASNIYGLSDAVVHGVTGILVKKSDERGLSGAISFFATAKGEMKKYSESARRRAVEKFSSKGYTEAVVKFYQSRISMKRLRGKIN